MNLISNDISTLLSNNGFTDIADGEIEIGQDRVIAVIPNEQSASDLKDTYYTDGFQIFVRSNPRGSQNGAWDTIKAVHNFILSQPDSIFIDGCEYKGFEMETSISFLGRDENERIMFSANYTTFRAPLSAQ